VSHPVLTNEWRRLSSKAGTRNQQGEWAMPLPHLSRQWRVTAGERHGTFSTYGNRWSTGVSAPFGAVGMRPVRFLLFEQLNGDTTATPLSHARNCSFFLQINRSRVRASLRRTQDHSKCVRMDLTEGVQSEIDKQLLSDLRQSIQESGALRHL